MTEEKKIVIEIERNYLKSVIFFIVSLVCISYFTLILIQIIDNRLYIYAGLYLQCIFVILALEADFFKREVKYQVIENKVWYGTQQTRIKKIK